MLIDHAFQKLSWLRRISLNLILIAVFFLLEESEIFRIHLSSSTPIWLPSGISLAVLLRYGVVQAIPGLVIGNLFLIDFNLSFVTIVGLVSAKLLEGILASMLLLSVGKGKFSFKRPKDIFNFIVLAGFLSPFISSTISITFMYLGETPIENIPNLWVQFYARSVLGVLVITPFILSFLNRKENNSRKGSYLEALFLYSALAWISYWAFSVKEARPFLIIPFLTWAALRFSFRGVSVASMIVTFFTIWSSSSEFPLIWVQSMIGGISIAGYFMATVSTAHDKVNEQEKELNINRQYTKIAEEALAILDQSLHKSPIGFALIDREYRYIRINETLAKINGKPVEAYIGKTLHEMVPAIVEKVIPLVERVFETGQPLMNAPFQGHLAGFTQEVRSGLVSYYPIRHPGTNEIFGVAFSFQDVTQLFNAQNLLRENQERLTLAQEAGKIGAFECCLDSNKVYWTTELENIYGLQPGEFGGLFESWMKWIHPEDLENTREEVLKVLNGDGELNHQFRIITKDHDIRWILARGKIVEENGVKAKLIGINIDLTEQKNYEQKLRLTEANLLHALSVRDEFVATASHELKTPLTSLKLQVQMYQRGLERQDSIYYSPEKIHNLLDKNSRQLDRLTRLVDDMLDISRIRTGKLTVKKEKCDLTQIIREILARTREQFLTSGSGEPIIEHFDHAEGDWDPLRIEQVITNIITNAIRYGQGKPITLSVKNYQECVRITIKDQGLGIPKSDHTKIFQRYERGLLRREVSGLGLGLFITQQILEAHSGKIWLESELNHGTSFFVDLPRLTEIDCQHEPSSSVLSEV